MVAEDASSEEDGIALLSMDILPDGATAQGIDVSEHQGRIDWNAVKASGIDFAILRVGFGAPSWGGRVDYQFNRNISECERLGIPYGVYIYSYAFDNQQAADEASMVINCLSGHNPRLPVYYDLEDNSIIANGRQTGIASRAQVFCNRISAAGYEPGIYANLNWFNNILTDSVFKSSSWDHWIAQYNSQCDYTGNYSFWQYKSNGKVPGINGNVDMNYAYVDVSLYHWQLIDSTWYYAASNGKAYAGWLFQSGTWYWLEPDAGGAMATGLHECNGSLYWFNSSGAMATGWVLDGGTWYYATGSGALARGPVSVGGVPYCFDARTGAMLTGYQTDAQGVRRYFGSCGPLNGWGLVDGSWYWFANGIASTGWLYTGGSWYWLDPDAGGAMVTGLHVCNDSAYWFSASGAMATGWVLDGGTWYYATGSGALASGWLSLSGAWYWLDPSTHAMTTGVQTIGSCEYIFNSTGKMMANCWSNGDGSWMYHSSSSGAIDLKGIMTDSGIQLIDDDGNARTGWIESQGSRYYCSANGVILTGWQQIAGSWYYFNSDGRMATGWLNDGGNWYWLDSASGIMKTGWLSRGGTWYYLDAARGGVMLSNGWYWIGSTDYKFSSSGAMVGAWVDVPCYSQYPELPTGCESVALTNLLNYYGFGLGKTIIADYYLPKGSNGNFCYRF
ncbi:MAG: C39 family peptidase [Collinsella sp.]|nr:C39 family peptidase [Collinsella sp.]